MPLYRLWYPCLCRAFWLLRIPAHLPCFSEPIAISTHWLEPKILENHRKVWLSKQGPRPSQSPEAPFSSGCSFSRVRQSYVAGPHGVQWKSHEKPCWQRCKTQNQNHFLYWLSRDTVMFAVLCPAPQYILQIANATSYIIPRHWRNFGKHPGKSFHNSLHEYRPVPSWNSLFQRCSFCALCSSSVVVCFSQVVSSSGLCRTISSNAPWEPMIKCSASQIFMKEWQESENLDHIKRKTQTSPASIQQISA